MALVTSISMFIFHLLPQQKYPREHGMYPKEKGNLFAKCGLLNSEPSDDNLTMMCRMACENI